MLLNNNSHVQGIFKYSDDIKFEENDFVVEGNCIYICTSSEPVIGELPSKHPEHYTAYPGDKITTAEEYYNYINTRDRVNGEDKYVSAYALCEILEGMYFGFGENGLVTDHVIYNPAEGIDYSIRSVKEVLNSTSSNILDRILQTEDLNNGLVKISRNIAEISDILQEDYNTETFESDVVILRQYSYFDTTNESLFRIQELVDPERNKLYFRFSKGQVINNSVHFDSASSWKNIYSNDEEIRNRLNTIDDYYRAKTEELRDLYNRLKGKYCYRNVKIEDPSNVLFLNPGNTKDIKSIESFQSKSCFLDIIIKSSIDASENLYKNYSITIDTKDAVDSYSHSEYYKITDDITLTVNFSTGGGYEELITLTVPEDCVIKDVYYRDYTLGHIHEWELDYIDPGDPCLDPVISHYHCANPNCSEEHVVEEEPRGHDMVFRPRREPDCTHAGNIAYYECVRNGCGRYYTNEDGTGLISNHDDVIIPMPSGGGQHHLELVAYQPPTCTEDGMREYYHCDRCNKNFRNSSGTNEILDLSELIIPATGSHTWNTIVQPTCTHTGTRVCRVCGETETLSMLAHTPGSQIPGDPGDCGHNGSVAYYECSMCRQLFTDQACTNVITDPTIYASGHHNLDSTTERVIREADYTDGNINEHQSYPPENIRPGLNIQRCTDCDNWVEYITPYKRYTIYERVGGTPHILQDNEWSNAAFYYNYADIHVPRYQLGWVYRDDWGPGHEFIDSETVIRRNFDIRSDVSVSAQLHNHTVVHQVVDSDYHHDLNYHDATCDEYGYWEGQCVLCNASNVKEYNWDDPPLNHVLEPGTGIEFLPNTCNEPARIIGTCSVCNQSGVDIIDHNHDPKGHPDENPTNNICDVCGRSLLDLQR